MRCRPTSALGLGRVKTAWQLPLMGRDLIETAACQIWQLFSRASAADRVHDGLADLRPRAAGWPLGDRIVATPLQTVEIGDAVFTIAAAFCVDDGVIDIKPADILDDPWITLGPVHARHGVEPQASQRKRGALGLSLSGTGPGWPSGKS